MPVNWRGTLAVMVLREHRLASKISYGKTRYEKLRDWLRVASRDGGACFERDERAAERAGDGLGRRGEVEADAHSGG